MTTLGLVAVFGAESTIDYYRRIVEAWERAEPSVAPSMVIDLVDAQRLLYLAATDHSGLAEFLLDSLRRLARAGVDFAAMTANTAHIVFDELATRSPVPLLSIVDVCVDEAQRRGLRRLALLGTRYTMEAALFPDACAQRDIAVVVPDPADRVWIHERYVGQLLKGDLRDSTRQEFVALVRRLHERSDIDGVILGGTELPPLLRSPLIDGVTLLDTTGIHVAAIVERLRHPVQAV
jgi:aspartate racemase